MLTVSTTFSKTTIHLSQCVCTTLRIVSKSMLATACFTNSRKRFSCSVIFENEHASCSWYTVFALAHLLCKWCGQRPSNKGDLGCSVAGLVGKVYYTGVDLLLISFLYRNKWLISGDVLNGTQCITYQFHASNSEAIFKGNYKVFGFPLTNFVSDMNTNFNILLEIREYFR
jgi:hypothetical protein